MLSVHCFHYGVHALVVQAVGQADAVRAIVSPENAGDELFVLAAASAGVAAVTVHLTVAAADAFDLIEVGGVV